MVSLAVRMAAVMFCAASISSLSHAQVYLFGLSGFGNVLVNNTKFYNLPSDFEVNAGVAQSSEEQWWDQQIVGEDQYHLRLDGLIYKNGERLDPRLPEEGNGWFRLAISPGGDVFAFDIFGRVAQNGTVAYDLPHNSSTNLLYSDFLYHEGDRYALRNDGRIYRNASGTEVWDLPGDAGSQEVVWIAFLYDEISDRIYCLRRDGIVRYVENGGPSDGEFVADLIDAPGGERYGTLVQDPVTQRLFAMRFDGSIYSVDPTSTPAGVDFYTDYPGDGNEEQTYLALALLDGEPLALRFDGELYTGLITEQLCKFAGTRYRSIGVGTTTPVATNVKAYKPSVSTYTTTCYPGDLVEFPILASDINTEDLTYTLLLQPDGSVYDDQTNPPTFSFTPAVEGKFELQVSISDGDTNPKIYKWKITVKAADTDPLKNKKPSFQKFKKLQTLVGVPIEIPLRAYDADGDPLVYTVGELPRDMTFDAKTATLSWVPVVCSDKIKIDVFADDGSGKLAKGKVQIVVQTPFWF